MGHKNKEGGRKAGGEASASAKAPLPAPSVNFNPKDVTDPLELLDMCVAALHDKSTSAATREAALASLVGALEGGVVPLDEATDGRPLVIFAVCGVSIKKGSAAPAAFAKEARLAYRAVGLLALTLHNGGATEILAESFPMLARTLQQPSSMDPTTVAYVLDCLAAVTFAGALGTEDAERSLKAIWGVVCPNPSSRSPNPKVAVSGKASAAQVVRAAAALSTWTFLLTTATITDAQRKADRAAWNATVASLAGLLQADDRAVRMAAGEALAVCVELNLTQHTPRKDMEAIKARVWDLAAEAGGKGVDKALLVEQKELFRQVSAYMERGERPTKALQTSSDRRKSIKVSTWAKMVQLNFLRRFLAAGFLSHVKGNKLFKESFDAGADEKSTLSIAKRKLSMKTKDKVMKMNREQAWAAKNVFCIPQGGPPEGNRPEQLLKLGWH
ncbi:uncharacterized protein [Miscanthus floridulus]|uniref:uncharacterized protein n=1 Tax=Miscanthus floridulus TaxID=154761 RepID=UPI00345A8768